MIELKRYLRYLLKKVSFQWKKMFWSELLFQSDGNQKANGYFPPIGSIYVDIYTKNEYVVTEYVHEKGIFFPYDYWEVWGYRKDYDEFSY